jgi:CheY-like chemotaxis protein
MFADPIRLQQVVWNVVSNAIKFTPEDGSVTVQLTRKDPVAEIEVRDTGRGIGPELLPQLFQRFRQGDASSSRKGGIGLGLAISRFLVEQHGGSIKASSEGIGQGATFTIELPVTIEATDPFTQREPNRAELLPDLSGIRVLIIEDEADNRDVLSTVIERCGAEVRCASNATDGLKSIQDWNPGVIVCDIALPDMDGCALITQVRTRSDTPALALTVFGSAEEEARVRSCGFDVFRQKPIEPSDLAHVIERLAAAPSPRSE